MTTGIQIQIEYRRKKAFSEDVAIGTDRVGRKQTTNRASTDPLSGVKVALVDHERQAVFTKVKGRAIDTVAESVNAFKFKNKLRQGVNIRSFADSSFDSLPYITVGNKQPYPSHYKQKIQSILELDFYGVKDVQNRENYVPFEDISQFDPAVRLNVTSINSHKMYPLFTGSHFTTPFEINAALEPFQIRDRRHDINMIDLVTHVSDRGFFTGIRGKLMGGGFEESEKGSVTIQDTYKITDKSNDILMFDDTRHVNRLTTTHLPINFKESSGKVILKPFSDRPEFSLLKSGSSYSFMSDGEVNNLYSESIKSLSSIGNLEVSATAGFVYESTTIGKTTLGTDSIAFGGFSQEKLNIQQTITTLLSYSLPS